MKRVKGIESADNLHHCAQPSIFQRFTISALAIFGDSALKATKAHFLCHKLSQNSIKLARLDPTDRPPQSTPGLKITVNAATGDRGLCHPLMTPFIYINVLYLY
jgi:hypothetical protein